jgi:hypothetical protein
LNINIEKKHEKKINEKRYTIFNICGYLGDAFGYLGDASQLTTERKEGDKIIVKI